MFIFLFKGTKHYTLPNALQWELNFSCTKLGTKSYSFYFQQAILHHKFIILWLQVALRAV